ncbi:hypothetical protein EU811_20845 [Arthrobacter sp. TS-15]|nr:hypothetical protein EU811_20845 [Arthrobacter sp. TS-15]
MHATPKEARPQLPLTVSEVGNVAVKYIALAVGFGTLAFAIKALLLVGMDTNVAAALVATTSPSAVVQMLLEVVPTIGIVLFMVLVYQAGRLSLQGPAQALWLLPLALLALAVIAPAILMLSWEAVWVLAIFVWMLVQSFWMGRSRRGGHYVRAIVPLVGLIAFIFVAATGMWLPREQIKVAGHDYMAYVTSDSEDSLVAYFPANKAVLRLEKSTVEKRQYCRVSTSYMTFGSMLRGTPNLPECPKDDQLFPIK